MNKEMNNLSLLKATRKTGKECFHQTGQAFGITILDFWQWAASDLVDNTMRGVLAEYIVANALTISQEIRIGWNPYDLETSAGIKIEVKSAAYLQSWYQKRLSRVCFTIKPTRKFDGQTNELDKEIRRQADIYVFCILNHKEKSSLDPLDLDQWVFYILLASELNRAYPTQKSIGLASLLKLGPKVAKYSEIASCIELLSGTLQHT